MLKLILESNLILLPIFNLNTTLVKVNRKDGVKIKLQDKNLNTTLVKVNLKINLNTWVYLNYLNTTLVKVNPIGEEQENWVEM